MPFDVMAICSPVQAAATSGSAREGFADPLVTNSAAVSAQGDDAPAVPLVVAVAAVVEAAAGVVVEVAAAAVVEVELDSVVACSADVSAVVGCGVACTVAGTAVATSSAVVGIATGSVVAIGSVAATLASPVVEVSFVALPPQLTKSSAIASSRSIKVVDLIGSPVIRLVVLLSASAR